MAEQDIYALFDALSDGEKTDFERHVEEWRDDQNMKDEAASYKKWWRTLSAKEKKQVEKRNRAEMARLEKRVIENLKIHDAFKQGGRMEWVNDG